MIHQSRNNKVIIAASFSVSVLLAVYAFSLTVSAADGEHDIIRNSRSGVWSDPLIWDGNVIPSMHQDVLITRGTTVTYDLYSTNEIGNIKIDGTLIFSKFKSTNLDVHSIEVSPSGSLIVGAEEDPIPMKHTATIRFVTDKSGESGLMVRGNAEIHGSPVQNTFTTLAADAKHGDSTLFVNDDVSDWLPGSKIVITTTGRNSCTEVKEILWSSSMSLTLDGELRCYHSGTEPAAGNVALLSRNVIITSKNEESRGHTMFMHGARGSISYAEFVNLGPEGQLGKYPIHFHMMNNTSEGMYVEGASVWNSNNRWITIHSSNGITLRNNVGYNSMGHGYFLEAGDETLNTLDGNIGILTRRGTIIPSDGASAVFWMENPYNTLINNVAVQGHYYGYKYDVPNRFEHIDHFKKEVNLRSIPILKFADNESHNNRHYGLLTSAGAHYNARGEEQEIPQDVIQNFVSWRNGDFGIIFLGRGTTVENGLFFGNAKANVAFRGSENVVTDSHLMGEVDENARPSKSGILFIAGRDNIVENSLIEKHDSGNERASSDVMIDSGEFIIHGKIVNTRMLSDRTIIFGYPAYSSTHLDVVNYDASNDNLHHGTVPRNFTLWRIDSDVNQGYVDTYFVAKVEAHG